MYTICSSLFIRLVMMCTVNKYHSGNLIWTVSSENVPSSMRKMRRFRSSCACAKYQPGLCSPFIHSIVSNVSVSGQWRHWSDCADAQADLGLRCPHMPNDTCKIGNIHKYLRKQANLVPPEKLGDIYYCSPSTKVEKKRRKKKETMITIRRRQDNIQKLFFLSSCHVLYYAVVIVVVAVVVVVVLLCCMFSRVYVFFSLCVCACVCVSVLGGAGGGGAWGVYMHIVVVLFCFIFKFV